MRLKHEQLNIIKEKMGVDKLWSFSKVSSYNQCSWLYKLKYVDKIKVKGDSCYTWWGSVSHDIVQDWREGKIEYHQMAEVLETKILEYSMLNDDKLKFPNESEFASYIANLRHYFSNVSALPYKVTNEKPVLAVFNGLEKYVFQGYLDSEFLDDDDNLIILDYKTSTIAGFTGKKLIEKASQLMIYAMGISQHGRMINGEMRKFPINKIKIRYDMMKYCNITYTLKNGNEKITKAERRLWVAHLANQIRKDLLDVPKEMDRILKEMAKLTKKMVAKKTTPEDAEGYSVAIGDLDHELERLRLVNFDPFEIGELIDQAILDNNLDVLPEFIKEKYKVTDCYLEVDMTEEVISEFVGSLVNTLDTIITKSKEEDKKEAFNRQRIDNSESFYCVNLCDMKNHCSFYKEFKEHNAMFANKQEEHSEEDLLAILGLN